MLSDSMMNPAQRPGMLGPPPAAGAPAAQRRLRHLARQVYRPAAPALLRHATAAAAARPDGDDDAALAVVASGLGLRCSALSPSGFGVRVSGLDTSQPTSPQTAALLRSLLARHKLLLIGGGRLSAAQLGDLGRSFALGPCEEFGVAGLVDYMSGFADEPNVQLIEYGPESAPADINIWHMDHLHDHHPTRFELSYCDVSPATGGDVIFADACAAYDSLSPRMQGMVKDTTCLTVLANGYQNLEIGSAEYAQAMLDKPGIEQPVISKDPDTGALSLNVNTSYSMRIQQLTKAESDVVLPMLCEHVTKPEHCLRIHYEVGDICLFDNHKVQHYAVSDYHPEPRRIMRMSMAPEKMVSA